MSLLMDALRKAELAKGGAPAEDADLPAPETAAPAPKATTLPDLPLSLEELDSGLTADLLPGSPASPSQASGSGARSAPLMPPPVLRPGQPSAADRAVAHNAFAAKMPAASARRGFAVAVGAATLLAIAAIGVYFWWQLRPHSNAAANLASTVAVRTQPAPVAASPAQVAPPEPPPVALAAGAADHPASATRPPAKATAESTQSPLTGANDPIRITQSQLKVDPALTEGFAAFQAGDLKKARAAYERSLADDPRNTDALRGAAAVALRQGRSGDAEAYYRRLVEVDPLDAGGQAGLVGLDDRADPAAAEERLKAALANQPDAAVLHFALGNLYARQSRWSEAQQAYFDAVTGDAGNPDYLYNLAVSLDQLHKANLAAQYYRQAMAAAANRPAGFDPAAAATRLRQLQP